MDLYLRKLIINSAARGESISDGNQKEFGKISASGRGTPKMLWMTWAGYGIKLFRNFLSLSKTFTVPQRQIKDKIRGELKVKIKEVKNNLSTFLNELQRRHHCQAQLCRSWNVCISPSASFFMQFTWLRFAYQ